jgi:glutathione S-transferase
MSGYLVYHFPNSCSGVLLNALEEIGLPYEDRGVALMRGEHFGAAYKALNPKSKVPVLVSDGTIITEIPVILFVLARRHPEAGLMPCGDDGEPTLESLSDLIWIAGGLHPLASRMFRPADISERDPEGVKASGQALLAMHADRIAPRLDGGWWYGAKWSIADTFISWVFHVGAYCGFPLAEYPALLEHRKRIEGRPAFARALARERAATARDELLLP